jgi:energy-coupling factor transport system ATP-binding protein
MIEIENLTYTYPKGQTPSLRGLNLRIREGEFVLLLGTSGCGKSTLCRTFNGLVPHFYGGRFQGEVLVDGESIKDLHPHDLADRVGMVFQDPENQMVMTNVENELAFGLENLGLSREEMMERVRDSYRYFDLKKVSCRFIPELSGGEKQKVALASVLAMRPKYLVLDEPTSQLDTESALSLLELVRRLNQELGLAIVLVEHRLERCLDFAERFVFMRNGSIIMDGSPVEVMERLKEIGLLRNGLRSPPDSRPDGDDVLEVRDLRFSYGREEVLRGASLRVGRGEIAAIVGPNGSGKSTLLKLIMGLLKPSSGQLMVLGKNLQGITTAQQASRVGYLGQNPNDYLFQETLGEELSFTLKNLKVRESEWEARISWTLGMVSLEHHRLTFPRDLSTGERERAALATILVGNPQILILDEPTRGLDNWMKERLAKILRDLRGRGMTTIIVTHDYRFVAESANRIFSIMNGSLREITMEEYRNTYDASVRRKET